MHRGQLQALVRVAGQRQVAQAVVALIAGRAVVAYITDVEQSRDLDSIILLQARAKKTAHQRAFTFFLFLRLYMQ
ncbi:hypothetical protein D9M68_948800 [compost metagenome]